MSVSNYVEGVDQIRTDSENHRGSARSRVCTRWRRQGSFRARIYATMLPLAPNCGASKGASDTERDSTSSSANGVFQGWEVAVPCSQYSRTELIYSDDDSETELSGVDLLDFPLLGADEATQGALLTSLLV